MTELIKIPEYDGIHWGPFLAAFLGAPLLVTLLTSWISISVFALQFGGPIYMIFGAPILIFYMRRKRLGLGDVIGLSIFAVLMILPLGLLLSAALSDELFFQLSVVYALFGLIFGPVWAAMFHLLYRLMTGAK